MCVNLYTIAKKWPAETKNTGRKEKKEK